MVKLNYSQYSLIYKHLPLPGTCTPTYTDKDLVRTTLKLER